MNERRIFEGALDFTTPADRLAFLDKACAGDANVRAGVEALLASHDAASRFLNVPAIEQLNGLERTIDHSSPHPDEDEAAGPDLSFLQSSAKPGSIGCLGHYEILQVLGHGGFGIVFRAFDEKLHRQVAVKAMNPQLAATSPPRKRFLREARSVAAIKHENIVQIYSVEEQPLPYLVMEFVQGQTLQQKLDGAGPLEPAEVLHLGRQMASGLAAAHALGLIHRDIKPGNILLEQGAEQKVKITDFGLARAADDASMTQTGIISGTPMYMAPEQATGQTLDARSDLFSLGGVLYQMCCGRPPFRGPNTIAVLRRVVEEAPRPLRDVLPEIPAWLAMIVGKLHAKNPDERYQTAAEVAELLGKCQAELQTCGKVTCVVAEQGVNEVRPEGSRRSDAPAWSRSTIRLVTAAVTMVALIGMGQLTRYVANQRADRGASLRGDPHMPTISAAAVEQSIDVIPLIDPALDKWRIPQRTGKNDWRLENGELLVGVDSHPSKLLFPLDSDWPSFECELEFTRRTGDSGFNLNLPTKNGECPLVLDPPGFGGMHLGSRQRGSELNSTVEIETGKRMVLRVTVRRESLGDHVTISTAGRTRKWTGDLSAIANTFQEGFPADRRLSLWIQGGTEFVFHRICVKLPEDAVVTTLHPQQASVAWPIRPADSPPPAIAPFDATQANAHQDAWARYLNVPEVY